MQTKRQMIIKTLAAGAVVFAFGVAYGNEFKDYTWHLVPDSYEMTSESGNWISGGTKAPECPAPVLEKCFILDELPHNAVLTLAVAGWHEVSVNGVRVGDEVLSPVTCQPDRRISSVSKDIAPYLKKGENTLSVLLGNGWFNCFTKDTWGFSAAKWVDSPTARRFSLPMATGRCTIRQYCSMRFATANGMMPAKKDDARMNDQQRSQTLRLHVFRQKTHLPAERLIRYPLCVHLRCLAVVRYMTSARIARVGAKSKLQARRVRK